MIQPFKSLKTKIMTEYMKAGNELPEEQPKPLDKTPFSDIEELRFTDGEDLRTVIEQAQKIHRTAKRNDSISNDDSVIESLALPNENIPRESFYAYKVGPLAQTCDALQWNTVFDIDLTTAPQPDSDAFREAASELNIPDTIGLKLAPEFIRSAYRLLWEHKEETGRPIHPHRLKADANAVLKPRIYPRVFDYLSQLPGVTGPTESPAWEYVDPEQPASTEAGEEAEGHV